MAKEIVIVGGGIMGLSSAHFLNQAGYSVTIIDKNDIRQGCSFGNAGMIVPSHFIPLAAPGMIAKGFQWMFDAQSPFYVKPRMNLDLIKWGWQFYKHANKTHVNNSIHPLKAIHLLSRKLYHTWAEEFPFNFGYNEKGLLMLYQTASVEKEEIEVAHLANAIGIEARVLTQQEIQLLEPEVKVKVRGGVYYPGDAHITPQTLVIQLRDMLESKGVSFVKDEVSQFDIENGRIKKVSCNYDSYEVDEVVFSAGIWTDQLSKQLNISLPMQAGKGYSFTIPDIKKNTKIPSIFLEPRVAVTPMGNSLRFGGTMEIAGINAKINMNRVKGITDSISQYYPDMTVALPDKKDIWYGLRPCPPDGLPFIGRSKRIKNLVIATGHSMMGLSLGPATGQIVAEIIDEQSPSIPIKAFDPDRFG